MKRPGLKTVAVGLFVGIALLSRPCLAPGQRAEVPPPGKSPAKESANADQIDRLIRQLGSANFTEREAASEALEAVGEPALHALRKAQGTPDPEIRRRIADLVKILIKARAPMRAKAWASLMKLGGQIYPYSPSPGEYIQCIDFGSADQLRDGDLALLQWVDEVEALTLINTRITDAGLIHLKKLDRLEILDLGLTKITNAGLEHLKNLETLTHLQLRATRVTDDGLALLKNLNRLCCLDLSHTQVTDAGLSYLKDVQGLQRLNLSRTQVTDVGLKELQELKHLESLSLEQTRVTVKGVTQLRKTLPNLQVLHQPTQAVDAARVERLIQQLGNSNFTERAAASKALDGMGEPALPALRKAQSNSDLEVRRHASELVKSLTRKRAPMRARAWDTLKKLNVDISSNTKTPEGRIGCISFCLAMKLRDEDLALLQWLDETEGLSLSGPRITDAGLVHLKKLYRLEILDLHEHATDAALEHLKGLDTLTTLVAGSKGVTDAGLAHLKGLNKLSDLWLSGTQVTDAGLEHIKELKNLTTLRLDKTQVTDAGLAKLKGLKKLDRLDLCGTQVTDAGVAHLKEIRTLTALRLDKTKVSDSVKAEWAEKERKCFEEEMRRKKQAGSNQDHRAK